MNGNISIQICAFVLIAIIVLIFFTKKNLRTYKITAYKCLLISVLASVGLDIISSVSMNYLIAADLVNITLSKMYWISIVVIANFIFIYSLIEIYRNNICLKQYIAISSIFSLSITFASPFIGIEQKNINGFIVTKGIFPMICFGLTIFCLLLTIIYVLAYRKKRMNLKLHPIIFFLSAILISTLLQYVFDGMLFMSFAMAVSAVYMYMCLENPEKNIDEETTLFNSFAFLEQITNNIELKTKYSIIDIALEEYNFIYETFGIKNGRRLIKSIGKFLNGLDNDNIISFRNSDYEFSIIINSGNAEITNKLVEEISERFKKTWNINNIEIPINISMCVMPNNNYSNNTEEVIDLLKYFMNEARKNSKKGGYGDIVYIDDKALERQKDIKRVSTAMKKAIEKELVSVYFQPIFNTKKNRYTAAEALIRVYDESGKPLNPELFIPLAEENGLILQFSRIVLHKVCKFIRDNDIKKHGIDYIEVNLSVVECMRETLADDLIKVMEEYKIDPSTINFEITETAAIKSEKILISNMNKLIDWGASFSLDDYGSGYSNLNYLIELPFDLVKLDKFIVWSYFSSDKAKVALESAISMIKSLNMKIVAEGIENKTQYNAMYNCGIDYIQGYYFSRPITSEAFADIISR